MYTIYTRNWWKENKDWPNGLEPDGTGTKKVIGYAETLEEARKIAKDYNENNLPGRLSRKAEFTNRPLK